MREAYSGNFEKDCASHLQIVISFRMNSHVRSALAVAQRRLVSINI